MARLLPRALAAGTAGTAAAAYFGSDETRRSLAIASVGSFCRLIIRGTNNLQLHDAHHLEQSLQRPAGTALLSVSNHIATVDDPHLLSSIVPLLSVLSHFSLLIRDCANKASKVQVIETQVVIAAASPLAK